MAISKKLLNKLDDLGAKYNVVQHRKVFTAYDVAQTTKKKLEQIVKTLLVKASGTYYLIHVPANKNIDLSRLAKTINVKKVTIPSEKEMVKALKIKPGSLTAFSFMHKVESVVDKSLLKAKQVVFSSGSFVESIEMSIKDFMKTADMKQGSFSVVKKIKKVKKVIKRKPKK